MQSLYSASWYRVSDIRPRLRSQANISRHIYRGERWFVLQDLASGRFLKLNPEAYSIVALMDGIRTLDEIWNVASESLGDDVPTQDEILNLLAQLHQSNVLLTDKRPDLEELDERGKRMRHMKLKQYISNPLALKIPLVDPDRLLTLMVGWISPRLHKWMMFIWVLIIALGIYKVALQWDELTQDITSRIFNTESLMLMWFIFPIVKAIHELGHGIAIKLFGGQCHEMGLMFLVLVPIPYVDASHASALSDKRQRIIIGMAGMMIELLLASVALWLWDAAEPGLLKAIFFQVIILAGITTLLFNANPLLRFDGYYIFADWLEVPNLGKKANQYVGYLVNNYLFGASKAVAKPHMTPREPTWLFSYSVASFAYRMFIAAAIVLLVADFFFFVGVLLAVWAVYAMVIAPLLRQLRFLVLSHQLDGHRQRAYAVTAAFIATLMGVLLLLPMPSATMAEGVIWMPEQSQIRAGSQCFATRVFVQPGSKISAGVPLLECEDAQLDAELLTFKSKLKELQARLSLAVTTDKVASQIILAEIQYSRDQLATLQLRKKELTIVSPHDGIFVMNGANDFAGKYLKRGDLIAYVLDPSKYTLLTVVPQGRVDLVRNRLDHVELRTADNLPKVLPARIMRQVPAATKQLPSMALSLEGGGEIGVKPGGESGQEPEAIVSLFQFEVQFLDKSMPEMLGNRAYVRFVHPHESLASQWYRNLRQLFLKRFAV